MDVFCTVHPRGFAMPPMKHGDVVPVFEKLPDDKRANETRSA
jgi:hypothetical protein